VEHYRSNSLKSVYKEVGTALLYPFKQTEGSLFYQFFVSLLSFEGVFVVAYLYCFNVGLSNNWRRFLGTPRRIVCHYKFTCLTFEIGIDSLLTTAVVFCYLFV